MINYAKGVATGKGFFDVQEEFGNKQRELLEVETAEDPYFLALDAKDMHSDWRAPAREEEDLELEDVASAELIQLNDTVKKDAVPAVADAKKAESKPAAKDEKNEPAPKPEQKKAEEPKPAAKVE